MKRISSMNPDAPDRRLLGHAAALLRQGRLVAYPTDTFYALGADPFSTTGIDRIFEAKGRPERMALPLIAADESSLRRCVSEFPDSAARLAAAFWPGALTLVLLAADAIPSRVLGGGRTVGVRLSSNPIAGVLAAAVGVPIVATSANLSGQPAPSSAAEVEQAIGGSVDLILDGGITRGGQASTVLDLTIDPPRVIRSGAVPLDEVEKILGRRLA